MLVAPVIRIGGEVKLALLVVAGAGVKTELGAVCDSLVVVVKDAPVPVDETVHPFGI